ncbi:MAG: YlzJ-like family protein [Bacillaceae bacterium]|nr:YlzJ-like family protein [Bacillaceae bacterium]
MIVYSAMPVEQIFDGMDRYQPEYQEVQVDGLTMLVEPVNAMEGKIVRLLSPNPQDYLNPKYTPGNKIFFRPGF